MIIENDNVLQGLGHMIRSEIMLLLCNLSFVNLFFLNLSINYLKLVGHSTNDGLNFKNDNNLILEETTFYPLCPISLKEINFLFY